MKFAEFERLSELEPQATRLKGINLGNRDARTLIYGYTCARETFHVYLDAKGVMHRVIYNFDKNLLDHKTEVDLAPEQYSPDKRLYPEACDAEFCALLKRLDVHLSFTNFNHDREEKQFHGEVLEDLKR